MDKYIDYLKINEKKTEEYYLKSLLEKTQQQIYLESLLTNIEPNNIADIACGAGGASFHFSKIWPSANFTLVDFNENAISLAKKNLASINADFHVGTIYDLKLPSNYFHLVICLQTLSWLEKPKKALEELIRICKSDGYIVITSLFNLDHDVDIYSKIKDNTIEESEKNNNWLIYNTYSIHTIKKWLRGRVKQLDVSPFHINIDLSFKPKGIGTYTKKLDSNDRIQISGGMLMNWGVLKIQK